MESKHINGSGTANEKKVSLGNKAINKTTVQNEHKKLLPDPIISSWLTILIMEWVNLDSENK